jgi:secreted trypsin-like serine protease
MRRSILFTLFLALAMLMPHSAQAIVYGVPDDGHRYVGSFVGTLTDPETGDELKVQLCTGTLIDSDVVLSASHCFVGLEEFGITSVAFTLDAVIDQDMDGFVDDSVDLLTGEPVTHELFGSGGRSNTYDVAVFLLDRAVTGVTPATLPPAGLLSRPSVRDDTFVAVGYGTTRETRKQAHQAFGVGWRRMMATQHINSVTRAWVTFSMNQATGNGGTCYGDSGGPHLLGDTVVAVTVTGDTFCKSTDTSYRVDTPWARDFLAQFVALP